METMHRNKRHFSSIDCIQSEKTSLHCSPHFDLFFKINESIIQHMSITLMFPHTRYRRMW
jgi:hypothetical protein